MQYIHRASKTQPKTTTIINIKQQKHNPKKVYNLTKIKTKLQQTQLQSNSKQIGSKPLKQVIPYLNKNQQHPRPKYMQAHKPTSIHEVTITTKTNQYSLRTNLTTYLQSIPTYRIKHPPQQNKHITFHPRKRSVCQLEISPLLGHSANAPKWLTTYGQIKTPMRL